MSYYSVPRTVSLDFKLSVSSSCSCLLPSLKEFFKSIVLLCCLWHFNYRGRIIRFSHVFQYLTTFPGTQKKKCLIYWDMLKKKFCMETLQSIRFLSQVQAHGSQLHLNYKWKAIFFSISMNHAMFGTWLYCKNDLLFIRKTNLTGFLPFYLLNLATIAN